MNTYKIDTHVHTRETSNCGWVDAKTVVAIYKEASYSGLVITDHYYNHYFDSMKTNCWTEKIDNFLMGYEEAKTEGDLIGIKVYLGMEIRFNESSNDYLVYGFDESFLYEHKELYNLTLKKFRQLISAKDILIYQAHPFRSTAKPANHNYLDGIEVYNGNLRHNSHNEKAFYYAFKNNLYMNSGSDFHRHEDIGRGGIIVNKMPDTNKELVLALKNFKNHDLILT
jgi:predicted metal-dependent phosphoesterase TrpH